MPLFLSYGLKGRYDPPSRVDAATHKKGGFESTYFHPPLNKGGWKGGKGGPPLKGGCGFVKYTLANFSSVRF